MSLQGPHHGAYASINRGFSASKREAKLESNNSRTAPLSAAFARLVVVVNVDLFELREEGVGANAASCETEIAVRIIVRNACIILFFVEQSINDDEECIL